MKITYRADYMTGNELIEAIESFHPVRNDLLLLDDIVRLDEIKHLVKIIDPSQDDNYALRLAAANGLTSIVEILLADNRVNAGCLDNINIATAAERGHVDIVNLLLANQHVNPEKVSLSRVIKNGHYNIALLLLKDGRINHEFDKDKQFLLKWATEHNHVILVNKLLNIRSLNLSADNNHLIEWAIGGSHLDIVKKLLADKRLNIGNSGLFINWALENGNSELIKALLEKEDLRLGSFSNRICKQIEMNRNIDPEIIKLLLSDQRFVPNEKLYLWAYDNNHAEIIELLTQKHNIHVYDERLFTRALRDHNTERVAQLLADKSLDLAKVSETICKHIKKHKVSPEVVKLFLNDPRFVPDNYLIEWTRETQDTNFIVQILSHPNFKVTQSLIYDAIKREHSELFRLLLLDERIDISDLSNKIDALINFSNKEIDPKIIKMLLEAPRFIPKPSLLRWAIEQQQVEIVTKLIENSQLVLSNSQLYRYLSTALRTGNTSIVEVMLASPRDIDNWEFTHLIESAVNLKQIPMVKLLLENHRAYQLNENIFHNCFRTALMSNHKEIIHIFLSKIKYLGMPLSTFFNLEDQDIITKVNQFMNDKDEYILLEFATTDAQKEALRILSLKQHINDIEKAERDQVVHNRESAMEAKPVLDSINFFQQKLKPRFEKQFMAYANDNEDNGPIGKMSAIIAIEKKIREMILDDILASSADNHDIINFIKNNKNELIEANNAQLMKMARENYFKSNSPAHAAWRGYDKDAPYMGYHKNLLTEQKVNETLFSTREAAQERGAISNVTASDEVREMVAYYYLLVTDKDEKIEEDPEARISIRKANFISELSDLRRAHSDDFQSKSDAPSCYPGYMGRLLNMGFEHTLAKELITPKNIVPDIMRMIILDKFKSSLGELKTQEECDDLLSAISNITERYAQEILLNKMIDSDLKKIEMLMPNRDKFSRSLGDEKDLISVVNQELIDRGYRKLTPTEQPYVSQYILDPARGKMLGYLAATHLKHIDEHFTREKIDILIEKIANPFAQTLETSKKLAAQNPKMFGPRVKIASDKHEIFHNLLKDLHQSNPELRFIESTAQEAALYKMLEASINFIYIKLPEEEKKVINMNNILDIFKKITANSNEWNEVLSYAVMDDSETLLAMEILETLKNLNTKPESHKSKGYKK